MRHRSAVLCLAWSAAVGPIWRAAAVLVACVSVFAVAASAQQEAERLQVTVDNANLRVAPSIDSAIVRALRRGTVVTVLGRDGAWVHVEAPSASGWMRASQLGPVATVDTAAMAVKTIHPATVHRTQAGPAMEPVVPSLRFAIHLGASESRAVFTGNATATFGDRVGLTGGLAVVVHGDRGVGLEVGVDYLAAGLTASVQGAQQSVRTAYIDVPVVARTTLGGRGGGLSLEAGGFGAYEVSCTENFSGSSGSASEQCTADAGFSKHRKFDWGAVGGVTVRVGRVFVEGRYRLGIVDLYQQASATGRTRTITISVGVTS